MRFYSLAVAVAAASSHFAEAHDVRVNDEDRGKRSNVRPGSNVRSGSKGVAGERLGDLYPQKREKGAGRKHHERKEDEPSLIVGGGAADVNEYPYFVYLGNCGGSLIAPGVVLSAAHCADENNLESYVGKNVMVGAVDNSIEQESKGSQKAKVVKSAAHPLYEGEGLPHDVMVMQLDEPITVSGTKLVVNQANFLPPDGATLTVVGLGNMVEDGDSPDELLEVDVPVVDHATCIGLYHPIDMEVIDELNFCAGQKGKDSCHGDSGGPIVMKQDDGSHRQVGITSYGEGCAREFPTVYARTSAAMDFIAYIVCGCFGVNDEHICSFYDPSDDFKCPGGGSGTSNAGTCENASPWVDGDGDGCDWYEHHELKANLRVCEDEKENIGTNGLAPSHACCVCKYAAHGGDDDDDDDE